MYGSHFVKNLIGMDWSVTRQFASLVVILRIVKRLRFINLSNQPFDAEKVTFGRFLSARARIIPVVTHKPEALDSIIHAKNSFSIVRC